MWLGDNTMVHSGAQSRLGLSVNFGVRDDRERWPGAKARQLWKSMFTYGCVAWRLTQESIFVDLLEKPHSHRHT